MVNCSILSNDNGIHFCCQEQILFNVKKKFCFDEKLFHFFWSSMNFFLMETVQLFFVNNKNF